MLTNRNHLLKFSRVKNGNLFPKLFWPTTVGKNFVSDKEKLFYITRKMYSESERSVQFLKQNIFWLGTGGFHVSSTLEQKIVM